MKILVVKTSSLGDVVHTLPAITDMFLNLEVSVQLDWLVEASFAEIPTWHPKVNKVIVVKWRKWRKNIWQNLVNGEIFNFIKTLRQQKYDLIIDAQGLIKSAIMARLARGRVVGFNAESARERLASWFYHQKIDVYKNRHAVLRVRELFSKIFAYKVPEILSYGISSYKFPQFSVDGEYVVLLHGTTWPSKHWPESYWLELSAKILDHNLQVLVPWGNSIEHQRALGWQKLLPKLQVLPQLTLAEIAGVISRAKALVAVDTGLGHVAAALDKFTISLYGATNPQYTGTYGNKQRHLAAKFGCAPCLKKQCSYLSASVVKPACFGSITPEQVWAQLQDFWNITEEVL